MLFFEAIGMAFFIPTVCAFTYTLRPSFLLKLCHDAKSMRAIVTR